MKVSVSVSLPTWYLFGVKKISSHTQETGILIPLYKDSVQIFRRTISSLYVGVLPPEFEKKYSHGIMVYKVRLLCCCKQSRLLALFRKNYIYLNI